MRLRILITAVAALAAAISSAQSYSSFYQVDSINGVHVDQSGLTYTVTVDPGAFLVYNGDHYDISDVFGAWAMKSGSALTASGSNQNGWTWSQSSSGGGSIAGWHNPNKNSDITPGEQLSFTYTTLDQPSVENFGFHMTFAQEWAPTPGAFTAFVSGPMNPVPEPASMAVLGLGALGLIRRRRRR